jgi:hypothetical protein
MGKIEEAIAILRDIGLPSQQQNERSGLTLLALGDLKKETPWLKTRRRNIRIHDILSFIEKHYSKRYAENTRETIRRQTLHQFEQAGLVVKNSDDSNRPTTSPNTVYELSDAALATIRSYNRPDWEASLGRFLKDKGKLIERYEQGRKGHLLSVILTSDKTIKLSPGKHNELQIKIISEFKVRFCPEVEIVYVGDTAKKLLYKNDRLLKELKIDVTEYGKLPDIILYDCVKNHIFLIEAVTAHGPVSPKRQIELEEMLTKSPIGRIYVSAFPDFREFKKHIDNIAWDTEVWIETNPDHMIHFNGEQFFNVYGE